MRKSVCVFVIFLSIVTLAYAGNNTRREEELFFNGNNAYKEGHYVKAAEYYEKLIHLGYTTGTLYYNLGNAYYRLGQIGSAILNYERAKLLMPRDADLDFNLRYVRDKTKDAVIEPKHLINQTFFWLGSTSLGELFLLFAILNLLFWIILLLRLFIKAGRIRILSEWIFYSFLVLSIAWSLSGISLALKWYQIKTDDRAVIMQKEVNVLAGPATDDTVLFKLHEGTIVHLERTEDKWVLVHLPDKKRGWVVQESVERIAG